MKQKRRRNDWNMLLEPPPALFFFRWCFWIFFLFFKTFFAAHEYDIKKVHSYRSPSACVCVGKDSL